jgi:hypothetical protein
MERVLKRVLVNTAFFTVTPMRFMIADPQFSAQIIFSNDKQNTCCAVAALLF